VELNAVVDEVVQQLKPEYDGRQIEWHIEAMPDVMCDPVLVKQLFINLLSNAVKYTRPRERAVIDVGSEAGGDGPVFHVADNGVGFDMKHASKLFGVFERLHSAHEFEGTGVGLAIVERIVRSHGGRVWAQAEPDRGATIYFTLEGGAARYR
jgi:light-regulated signal transduction histidine kinase (bacteriophytochrome)